MMKVPAFMTRHIVEQDGDSYTLKLTKKQLRIAAIVLAVILVVAIALGVWGIIRQAEVMQLRQQTQLQTEQLKLLQQKTEILDKKMQTLDQLDKEIRQMVIGAESGTTPKGGGTLDKKDTSSADKSDDAGPAADVTPTELSAKLAVIDRQAQQRIASFYLLRNVLRDGAGQSIKDLQSIAYTANSPTGGGATVTTPSIWPVKGVITSPFGDRSDPVRGGGEFHAGIDIAKDYGTPIVATAAGTVEVAGYTDGGYGNLVEINHGNGFETLYGHTSVVLVHPGMHVNQGDTIALMGSTGKSTGSHVHYEVRVNGSAVDPMLFLPIQ